ncbi:hypothetical protein [Ilumatobacter sp.]|uniref:hypothetical protein n=1 Tax=Ilumatobacter sp. TaxID=1967498 RepID=UPI003B52C718
MSEIERTFRLEREPERDRPDRIRIVQGYVTIDREAGTEVRVRRSRPLDGEPSEAVRVLTVKAGTGLERAEVEIEIGVDDFDALMAVAGDRRIDKTRTRIPLDGRVAGAGSTFGDVAADGGTAPVAEVDVHRGPLAGLVVAEVEFADRAAAESFVVPAWFGEELTDDHRWSNAALATSVAAGGGLPGSVGPVPGRRSEVRTDGDRPFGVRR